MTTTRRTVLAIVFLVFLVTLLPFVAGYFEFLKQALPLKWNLYALLPELPKCELPVSLSFGIDGCSRTCPLQYGQLQRITKISEQLVLWLKPGQHSNINEVRCLAGLVQTVVLDEGQLNRINRKFDRNVYFDSYAGHETGIFLFNNQGALVDVKPYNRKE